MRYARLSFFVYKGSAFFCATKHKLCYTKGAEKFSEQRRKDIHYERDKKIIL